MQFPSPLPPANQSIPVPGILATLQTENPLQHFTFKNNPLKFLPPNSHDNEIRLNPKQIRSLTATMKSSSRGSSSSKKRSRSAIISNSDDDDSDAVFLNYFKKGAEIEISIDEDGFGGSWFGGTVIRPPKDNSSKVVVEYATLLEGRRPVRESLDLEHVRPPPPREKHVAFKVGDIVDAYHRDGWWEGSIDKLVGMDKYLVFFDRTGEKLPFKAYKLRLHRDWVVKDEARAWVPPLKEMPKATPTIDKTPFSPKVKVNKDVIEHQFSPGDDIEVGFDDEGFDGAWFVATVLKRINNRKYLIECQNLLSDNGRNLREEVDGFHMRPHPPDIGLLDRFDLYEEVDAFLNDGWWVGMISKVLKNDRYIVFFSNTKEELKFEHSKLRVHQDWKNGKWYIASKVLDM